MLKKSIVLALSFSTLSSITAVAQHEKSSSKYNDFYLFYKDSASRIVQNMSLEEKIGQMTLVNMKTIKRESAPGNWDAIEKYQIGAVLADGDEMPETRNPNLADWQKQMHNIGSHAVTLTKDNKTHIRLLLGNDAVHGNQHVANAVIFPHNIGLGAAHDPALVKQIAAWTTYDIKLSGFNWIYAPTVAVVHDYRWGRTYESFGSDPFWIKQFATAYVLGAQQIDDEKHQLTGALTATKHFIGDGNTDQGQDEGNATVKDEAQFIQENDGGYEGAFSAGTGNVMVSYSSINGIPLSVNKTYLQTYLFVKKDPAKPDLAPRFNGFTVSDYAAITKTANALHQPFHETLADAINAGLDMIMVSEDKIFNGGDIEKASADAALPDHSGNISTFQAALQYDHDLPDTDPHKITDQTINEAVTQILQVKLAMGLVVLDDTLPVVNDTSQANLTPPAGNENTVALQAAEESLVLLKNNTKENQRVIPFSTAIKHLILLGNQAHDYTGITTPPPAYDNIGEQVGGWRLQWQGLEGNEYTDYDGKASSILTGIKRTAPGIEILTNPDIAQLDPGIYSAKNTVVIAVISEPPYSEFMGDVGNGNFNYAGGANHYLPVNQPNSLILNFDAQILRSIKALKEKNIPVVSVLLSGRPRIVNSSEDAPLNLSDAFIAAWLPGTTGGEAIANALFGTYHFVGSQGSANTLPVPWPKDMASIETGRLVCASIRKPADPMPLYDDQTKAFYDCGYGLGT